MAHLGDSMRVCHRLTDTHTRACLHILSSAVIHSIVLIILTVVTRIDIYSFLSTLIRLSFSTQVLEHNAMLLV